MNATEQCVSVFMFLLNRTAGKSNVAKRQSMCAYLQDAGCSVCGVCGVHFVGVDMQSVACMKNVSDILERALDLTRSQHKALKDFWISSALDWKKPLFLRSNATDYLSLSENSVYGSCFCNVFCKMVHVRKVS